MVSSVELIEGPPVSEISRERAEDGLKRLASKRNAAYALEQIAGHWAAVLVTEEETKEASTKEAGPPPFVGGGPADADEEAPGPKSEGPDDAEPSEGDDSDDSGDNEAAPPKPPKPEKSEGGKGAELHQIMQMLKTIITALGLDNGADSAPDAGPGTPPPPPPGPPGGRLNEQHVIHERVTKPGETPPGGTPIGAPAFASVREDHPWARLANRLASFEVTSSPLAEHVTLEDAKRNLDSLASEIGYRVARLREIQNAEGQRIALAVITKHPE